MNIKKVCRYRGHNYNLLPAVLVTPKEDGFIVAFKWWNLHFGVYMTHHKRTLVMKTCGDGFDSRPEWVWTPDDEIVGNHKQQKC